MFLFSLEKVLDVRRREEESAQRELARAFDELARIERRISDLHERRSVSASERRSLAEQRFDQPRLEIYDVYSVELRDQIVQAGKEAEAARKQVETRRAVLIETKRKCEMLEELKKVEFQEYQRQELAEERKRNDDVAVFAFGRRRLEKNSGLREARGK